MAARARALAIIIVGIILHASKVTNNYGDDFADIIYLMRAHVHRGILKFIVHDILTGLNDVIRRPGE